MLGKDVIGQHTHSMRQLRQGRDSTIVGHSRGALGVVFLEDMSQQKAFSGELGEIRRL